MGSVYALQMMLIQCLHFQGFVEFGATCKDASSIAVSSLFLDDAVAKAEWLKHQILEICNRVSCWYPLAEEFLRTPARGWELRNDYGTHNPRRRKHTWLCEEAKRLLDLWKSDMKPMLTSAAWLYFFAPPVDRLEHLSDQERSIFSSAKDILAIIVEAGRAHKFSGRRR